MTISVFFDTEFTTLKAGEQPYLISIGCVAEDGREFYAELSDTWHAGLCSEFVVENVLPLLQGGEYRMTEAELAVRLKRWIEELTDEEVIFRTDAPRYDWPWIEALGKDYGWPTNLRHRYGTVYFEDGRQHHHYLAAMEFYWKEHITRQHHALVDARSMRFAWKYAVKHRRRF